MKEIENCLGNSLNEEHRKIIQGIFELLPNTKQLLNVFTP